MLTGLPDFPVPDNAIDGMLNVRSDGKIRYALFPATTDVPRGTVCLLNGRAEFIEKYFEVVGELRQRGFAVAAMDWHGQGLSTRHVRRGQKGHVDSFATYENELETFVRQILLPDCPPPFYGLGHSMGGHVLLRYSCRGANPFDRIVLSAPMIAINFHRIPARLVKTVSEAASLVGLASLGAGRPGRRLEFEGNPLTRDRARFDRMNALIDANPDLGLGAPTLGWLHAATVSSAIELDPAFAAAVSVPVLIVIGTADRVVSVRAAETMGRRLKSGRTLMIPGARHEILMEVDEVRDAFWAAFDAFVPGETERAEDTLSLA